MKPARSIRGESVEADAPVERGGDLLRRPPFRMGDVEVLPALHRLVKDERIIQLEPKTMEVMLALARRPGDVVSRHTLQQSVWGTPFVSEDLPRRAISLLRKALDDDPRAPRYIETIPRAGYRLLQPVDRLAASPAAGVVGGNGSGGHDGTVRSAAPRRSLVPDRAFHRGLGIALALLLTAAVSVGLLRQSRTGAPPPIVTPLTASPGPEVDPAISPDGSRVAFLRAADSATDAAMTLEVQLFGTASSLTISDAPADLAHPMASPAWSPDGTRIAYRRWRTDLGWGLFEVPVLGGPEHPIRELGRGETSGLTWSPDGGALVLGRSDADGRPMALHRLDLDTGTLAALTEPPATSVGDALPTFSPDGSRIAFARFAAPDAAAILTVDADGANPIALHPGPLKVADLDWSADGRSVLLATFGQGSHRLLRIEATSGHAQPIVDAGEGARWLSVSRTGDRLVYARARFELAVREVDLETGEAAAVPALSSTYFDEGLALSPDGARLALVSTRSGSYELWTLGAGGEAPRRLTDFGGARVGWPTWVDGGRSLVFEANPDGAFDLWTVPAAGGAPRRLSDHPAADRSPSASHDGSDLVFASDRSGRWELWSMPASGGPAIQVTDTGAAYGRLSSDGAWLYFTRPGRVGLWRQRPQAGAEPQPVLANAPRSWGAGNWLVRDEDVWAVTYDVRGDVFLTRFDLATGQPVRRIRLPAPPVHPSLTLSPRPGRLLLATLERVESDLIQVDGLGR